jgi:hypothetical protein
VEETVCVRNILGVKEFKGSDVGVMDSGGDVGEVTEGRLTDLCRALLRGQSTNLDTRSEICSTEPVSP